MCPLANVSNVTTACVKHLNHESVLGALSAHNANELQQIVNDLVNC